MGWLTDRRRRHLTDQPFPAAWKGILETHVAAYATLDGPQRERLHELVQVFVAEKTWEGCAGFEITDEVRVTIAGSACVMLLGRDHDLFRAVESILVYPSAIEPIPTPQRSAPLDRPQPMPLAGPFDGASIVGGPILLAWDSVVEGARDHSDARNVVVHELALKIDELGGDLDGTPPLDTTAQRKAWGAAFGPAYLAHQGRVERKEPTFLRAEASLSESEFFAVASEAFFEQPAPLAIAHPELYAVLRDFYRLDLARSKPPA